MAITHKWLTDNASQMSMERGEQIADNQAIDIVKVGNHYTAKVYGERPYRIEYQDEGVEPIATCTCPFDWGGICKHIVAVGLAIVKGNYETEDTNSIPIIVAETKAIYAHKSVDAFLEQTFWKAELQTQQAFLRQLFTQNPTFMAQFEAFIKVETAPVNTKSIGEISQKVAKAFSKIPLDVDKMYQEYDNYDDEDDGTDWAREKLEKKFSPYSKQGLEILGKGNLIDFLIFEIGVYEGLMFAEEPIYNSGYDEIFEDYQAELQDIFSEHLQEAFPVVEKMIIQDGTAIACSNLLLDRADFYLRNDKLEAQEYNFRAWEAFWLYCIQSKGAANHLLNRLKYFSVFLPEIPRLVMKAAKIVGDMETWAITAEAYCAGNKDIALEILNYYQQQQDIQGIVSVVNTLFTKEGAPDTSLLLNYLTPEADKTLYMSILSAEVRNKRNLGLYKKFAEMASDGEKAALIYSLSTSYDSFFYAQVLATEKEYEKVFALMEKAYREKEVSQMLKLIAPHLTEKAWEWTKKWASDKMETGKRGRDLYNAIAQCVALFLPITGYDKKAKTLATGLQGMYPRMTALREELQRAKLL